MADSQPILSAFKCDSATLVVEQVFVAVLGEGLINGDRLGAVSTDDPPISALADACDRRVHQSDCLALCKSIDASLSSRGRVTIFYVFGVCEGTVATMHFIFAVVKCQLFIVLGSPTSVIAAASDGQKAIELLVLTLHIWASVVGSHIDLLRPDVNVILGFELGFFIILHTVHLRNISEYLCTFIKIVDAI